MGTLHCPMPQATPSPGHLDGPQILKLTCDTYRHLSARRHNATLEEYRAMLATLPTPPALARRAYQL
jgi:hypothetical protein